MLMWHHGVYAKLLLSGSRRMSSTAFELTIGSWILCGPCGTVAPSPVSSPCHRVRSGLDRDMGLPWQVVKVAGVSLWALFREKKEKPRN